MEEVYCKKCNALLKNSKIIDDNHVCSDCKFKYNWHEKYLAEFMKSEKKRSHK